MIFVVEKKNSKSDNNLKGIGGWLLFFVILWILGVIGSIISLLSNLVKLTSINGIIFTGIGLVITIILLVLVKGKKKDGPSKIVLTLWVSFVLVFMGQIIGYFQASNMDIVSAFDGISPGIVQVVIIAITVIDIIISLGWTILLTQYFKRSVRVKNTFVE